MVKDDNKILMIFIEPTPYILDLITILNTVWLGQIDILFLKKNFSQDWGLSIKKNYHLWSNNPFIIIPTLYQRLVKEKYKLIFLAGWIHPVYLKCLLCFYPQGKDKQTILLIMACRLIKSYLRK